MKILIVVLLVLVVVSLFGGLFFMFRDKSGAKRTVNALTLRVALSVLTFAIIMAGFFFGWLPGK
jgi:flagellar basal body-associated protein FliL